MNLEAVGKIAELQYEMTPFQIGTTGMYDGKKFEIIGRLKVAYEDGFWNEWYTIFGGDETGWLAEAQGFLAMCTELSNKKIPDLEALKPGKLLNLEPHGQFEVEDMRRVHCIFSEGELPMNAPQGRRSHSVDLVGPDLRMATVEFSQDEIRVYAGRYQEFDDFTFQNLRRIDGW